MQTRCFSSPCPRDFSDLRRLRNFSAPSVEVADSWEETVVGKGIIIESLVVDICIEILRWSAPQLCHQDGPVAVLLLHNCNSPSDSPVSASLRTQNSLLRRMGNVWVDWLWLWLWALGFGSVEAVQCLPCLQCIAGAATVNRSETSSSPLHCAAKHHRFCNPSPAHSLRRSPPQMSRVSPAKMSNNRLD